MKAGQTAEAVQDFAAAAGKPQFQDYAQDRIQSDEEAYLSAGYPPGEAKLLANVFLAAPQLVQVKDAGQSLVALAAAYQQSGDQSFAGNDSANGRQPRSTFRRSVARRDSVESTHRHLDRARRAKRNGPQRPLRRVRANGSTTPRSACGAKRRHSCPHRSSRPSLANPFRSRLARLSQSIGNIGRRPCLAMVGEQLWSIIKDASRSTLIATASINSYERRSVRRGRLPCLQ